MQVQPTELDVADEVIGRLDAEARQYELTRAMQALPAPQREAVELHVLAEMPYVAVAHATSSSEANARMRVMRGLGKLRHSLDRDQGNSG